MVDQVFEVECWRLTSTSGSKPIGVPKPEVSRLSSCPFDHHGLFMIGTLTVLMDHVVDGVNAVLVAVVLLRPVRSTYIRSPPNRSGRNYRCLL